MWLFVCFRVHFAYCGDSRIWKILFVLRSCDRASWHDSAAAWHVTVHRDMWSASWHVKCIVTCDSASDTWPAQWHVTVHRDMWPCCIVTWSCCVVTCDRTSWHVAVHLTRDLPSDMWSCIVTCDRAASWHVTMHCDMLPCCIVTNFFVIKPTGCTNFTNLFWHETTCFGQFVCP
jgi:hypothetical protein